MKNLWCAGGDFGSLCIVVVLEQRVELAHEEVLGAGQVVTRRHPQREVRVLQRVRDVLDDVVFLNTHRQHLSARFAELLLAEDKTEAKAFSVW